MIADRKGRLEYRPKRIKIEIFPCDNVEIPALIGELEAQGLVRKYEVDGKEYLDIPGFTRHQNPHMNEKASDLPPFPEQAPGSHDGKAVQAPEDSGASTVQAPELHGATPADSLIPDSLIPDSKNSSSGTEPPDPPVASDSEPHVDEFSETTPPKKPQPQARSAPVAEIIDYLNLKTGKAFSPDTAQTVKHLKARWARAPDIEKFKRVVDNMASRWKEDAKMSAYLSPDTLFGSDAKFEKYLNAGPGGSNGRGNGQGDQAGQGRSGGSARTDQGRNIKGNHEQYQEDAQGGQRPRSVAKLLDKYSGIGTTVRDSPDADGEGNPGAEAPAAGECGSPGNVSGSGQIIN